VNSGSHHSVLDWEWLNAQPATEELQYVRHLHFEKPLTAKINGHKNKGVILKPGTNV
jgi:hypothetical protein